MQNEIIEKRKSYVIDFLNQTIGQFGLSSYIKTEIKLNDDSESEYTCFEVLITNSTNKNKAFTILSVNDDDEFSMLRGEDFQEIDEKDFLRYLFFDEFLTYHES